MKTSLKVSTHKDVRGNFIKEGDWINAFDYKSLELHFPKLPLEVIVEDNIFYVENYYASKMTLDDFMEDNAVNILEKGDDY